MVRTVVAAPPPDPPIAAAPSRAYGPMRHPRAPKERAIGVWLLEYISEARPSTGFVALSNLSQSVLEVSARRALKGPRLPGWSWYVEVATEVRNGGRSLPSR
jgi:hypothetical protein